MQEKYVYRKKRKCIARTVTKEGIDLVQLGIQRERDELLRLVAGERKERMGKEHVRHKHGKAFGCCLSQPLYLLLMSFFCPSYHRV